MSMSNGPVSDERAAYLRQVRREKTAVNITKIGLLVGLFVLWEVAARAGWIDPFITSQPTRVIATLHNLWSRGELMHHLLVTTGEAVAGFLSGTILGTLIAILLWCSSFFCKGLEPYLVGLNSRPKIALGPIFIVWIGAGPFAIVVITLTISIVVTILEVLNGFLATDPEKIRLVQTFGA